MALKVDYYTSLLRAVGDLDRDAYAARGAIYEREHKALMRLLFSAEPPRSEAEIEREQGAFREAVRRVEFGNDENDITLAPFSAPPTPVPAPAVPPVVPPVMPPVTARPVPPPSLPARVIPAMAAPPVVPVVHPGESYDQGWTVRPPDHAHDVHAHDIHGHDNHELHVGPPDAEYDADFHSAPEAEHEPQHELGIEAPPAPVRKRKPMAGFLLRRLALAAVLLAVGAWLTDLIGNGNASAEIKLPQWIADLPPWLTQFGSDGTLLHLARDPNAQQAIAVDSEAISADDSRASGKAVWRMRMETAEGASPVAVLELDLEIPERHIALKMAVRREAPGGAMSHLAELRFIRENMQPDADLANIGSLYMTTAEGARRAPLLGRVLRVAPGIFLFGMTGAQSEREQNLRNFKELPWVAIPVIYRNGFYGTLIVEKGAAGERVINEVLSKWEQNS